MIRTLINLVIMRKLFYMLICSILGLSPQIVKAQDCVLPIGIYVDDTIVDIPANAKSVFENTLKRIALQSNINAELGMAQFILTAKVNQLESSVVPGAPVQVVNTFGVTLYIVDAYNKQTFASEYFEVDGVGTSEVKSYNAAFRSISAQNANVRNLLQKGEAKVISYYDEQYPNILKEAERKANLQQYEEALALATAIPTCSKGGEKAQKIALQIYTKNLNRINVLLLNKAQAIWAANQDNESANEAAKMLALIDPESECYRDAQSLMSEIKKQQRKDIDFNMREKYADTVALEKARIEASRAIGVAYGNGQKQQTTNLAWIR
jgi:hypothetical protein